MPPAAHITRSSDSVIDLCDKISSLIKHPGLVFFVCIIFFGVWVARSRKLSGELRPQYQHQETYVTFDDDAVITEKPTLHRESFSDLPPPLRSVVWQSRSDNNIPDTITPTTSGTLLLAPEPEEDTSSLPLFSEGQQGQRQPSLLVSSSRVPGPWRRHSYPSQSPSLPHDQDQHQDPDPELEPSLKTNPISHDETAFYPILDESDGTGKPGMWRRRRTLVFDGLAPLSVRECTVFDGAMGDGVIPGGLR